MSIFQGKSSIRSTTLETSSDRRTLSKMGLDFIGPIHPSSTTGHTHILMATDYFTKWVEAILVKQTTSEVVCNFIRQNILVRFGVPNKIVTDNATNFSSQEISFFCYQYGIILSHSLDYFEQGNG